MKTLCEFYCQICTGYTYFRLNLNIDGNHVVICANPACGHKHYRYVKNGEITEDRFYEGQAIAQEIKPMPSAYSRMKRQLGQVALMRQQEAIGMNK